MAKTTRAAPTRTPAWMSRVATAAGPVYVWTPPGYQRRTASVIVYVHGFFDNVDSAWTNHALARQFEASGRNALFVVPEAPQQAQQPVPWPRLNDLMAAAKHAAPALWPLGPLVAVGHSAAYRTIAGWLSHPHLDEIVLVDGLYGFEDEYEAWLRARRNPRASPRRLLLVVLTTKRWADPFVRKFKNAARLVAIPTFGHVPAAARRARLVAMTSQYGHEELIKDAQALPVLLTMTRVGARASTPSRTTG